MPTKDVKADVTLSRQVKSFRGSPLEFHTAFPPEVCKRVSYTTSNGGWMGMDTGYSYSLHMDRTAAHKAVNRGDVRRFLLVQVG